MPEMRFGTQRIRSRGLRPWAACLLGCAACLLPLTLGAQYDSRPAPSPPPPKGAPKGELPKTNPAKAPSNIRKAVHVPKVDPGPVLPGRAGAEGMVQQAFASYEQGNYPLALEQLDAAEKARPGIADASNLRGAILLKQGQFDLAKQAFRRAVNLDPSLWAAKFNVAEVPFRKKDYVGARKAFEDLSIQTDRYKMEVEWELVQYKIVVCSLLAGDEANAKSRFGRLRQNGASPAFLYAQAAFAFAKKDTTTANKFLGLADSSGRPNTRAIFSDTLVRAGWVVGAAAAAPVSAYDPTAGQTSGPRARGLPVQLLPPQLETDLPRAGGEIIPFDATAPKDEPPLQSPTGATPTPKPVEAPPSPTPAVPKPKANPEDDPSLTPPPLARPPNPKVTRWEPPDDDGEAEPTPPNRGFMRAVNTTGRRGLWQRVANETVEDATAYAAKLREAQGLLKTKDYDGAARVLEEAISLSKNPAEVFNLQGSIAFYRADYGKAEELFKRALVAQPGNWPAKFNLAEIAFVKKDYDRAREQYEGMLPETDSARQPVEREMLEFKVFLALFASGKTEMAERTAGRLPLAGQTPARYYAQIALEVSRRSYAKAAEVLKSADTFYSPSLNFLFSQPLEKLGLLPLPDPSGESPGSTPPSTAEAAPKTTPAGAASSSVPPNPEARLLDDIVSGGETPSPIGSARVPAPLPASVVAEPTPRPPEKAPQPIAQIPEASPPPRPGERPSGWLASVVRTLFPGSEPTRLEVMLFALGAVNSLALVWLLGSEFFARLFRPRALSLHTAGSVGVAVNKVRNIERLRVRMSIANMTHRSQTVGQIDAVMENGTDWKRTFHWRTLCLNPSSNASAFEEMDVYPLVLLPGEVASLYIDFAADAEDLPAQWNKGRYLIRILAWTEAAAGRPKPDFQLSFPLEIPSIPWKNQEFLVDLAIGKAEGKEDRAGRERYLDAETLEELSGMRAGVAPDKSRRAEEAAAKASGNARPGSSSEVAPSPFAPPPPTTKTSKRDESAAELPLFAAAERVGVPASKPPEAMPSPNAPTTGLIASPSPGPSASATSASASAARPPSRLPSTTPVPLEAPPIRPLPPIRSQPPPPAKIPPRPPSVTPGD